MLVFLWGWVGTAAAQEDGRGSRPGKTRPALPDDDAKDDADAKTTDDRPASDAGETKAEKKSRPTDDAGETKAEKKSRPADDDSGETKAARKKTRPADDESGESRTTRKKSRQEGDQRADDRGAKTKRAKDDDRGDARSDARGKKARKLKPKRGKGAADERGASAARKKTSKKTDKKKAKKKKKGNGDQMPPQKNKKKKAPEELTYGLGLKVGVMPYNTMTARPVEGQDRDYDMSMAVGWGVAGEYRIVQGFYLTGEFMYWYPEIESVTIDGKDESARTSDGLFNLGGGLRINVYGKQGGTDRVYIKGLIGFTDYAADSANAQTTGDENRVGMYYGGSVGIEHLLSKIISLYADTGFYWNSFSSAAEGEADARLFNWQLAGGFFVHFN